MDAAPSRAVPVGNESVPLGVPLTGHLRFARD